MTSPLLEWATHCDTIFDIDEFSVELEQEVEEWLDDLRPDEFGAVAFRLDRLAAAGSALRGPHSKALGSGLYELRFDIDRVSWRITYWFAPGRTIVLLTVFRKQRMNEKAEIERARRALVRCKEIHLIEGEN